MHVCRTRHRVLPRSPPPAVCLRKSGSTSAGISRQATVPASLARRLIKAGVVAKRHLPGVIRLSAWAELVGYTGSLVLGALQLLASYHAEQRLLIRLHRMPPVSHQLVEPSLSTQTLAPGCSCRNTHSSACSTASTCSSACTACPRSASIVQRLIFMSQTACRRSCARLQMSRGNQSSACSSACRQQAIDLQRFSIHYVRLATPIASALIAHKRSQSLTSMSPQKDREK